MSKTAKAVERLTANIAKLTERKDMINTEIQSLHDQRTALKAAPAPSAPKKTVKAAAKK
jgi:cell division protein FtsB